MPLEAVLRMEELTGRAARGPDYKSENRALVALAAALAGSPGTVLQKMAEILLKTFRAGSAGFSLPNEVDAGQTFYWPAIAGKWKPFIAGGTPRSFGPCGDVIDGDAPLLFTHPERRYTYLADIQPLAEEFLIIPFHLDGKAVGTLWIVSHDEGRKFDAEDLRQLVSMGTFASSAWQLSAVQAKTVSMIEALVLGSIRQHEMAEAAEQAHALLKNEIATREKTDRELEEQARLLDLSHDAIIVRDMKGAILFWNHGAQELYGWTREEVLGKISHLLLRTKFPTPLKDLVRELRETGRWNGELIHTKRDGSQITVLASKTLDRDAQGRPVAVLENLTDVTARKIAEGAHLRLEVMTASNLKLEKEIIRRQAVEDSLIQSRSEETRLLSQSRQQEIRLRELSHRIIHAQEEERKRISRELHDVIAQTLVGINVHVAALAKEASPGAGKLRRKIASTHRMVEQSVEIVHQFARELRPTMLDDLGLLPALKAHLQEFMRNTGIRVSLKAFAGIEAASDTTRTVLYRIAQEALANVAKHSRAANVGIAISIRGGTIAMEIADDGKGFDPAGNKSSEKKKRLGLIGMRERAEMIGGVFSVDSAPGQATTIRVTIEATPVKPKPAPGTAAKKPAARRP